MYRNKKKAAKGAKPVAKAVRHKAKVNHFAQPQPAAPASFYERYLKNQEAIAKGIAAGHLVKGRIYMTVDDDHTPVGYVQCEGLPQVVKVWGLRNLNRCFQMDEVVLRFVQWTEWGRASDKKIAHINFSEHTAFTTEGGAANESIEEADDKESDEDQHEEEGNDNEEGNDDNEEGANDE